MFSDISIDVEHACNRIRLQQDKGTNFSAHAVNMMI